MVQFHDEFLKDQEEILRINYPAGVDPDDNEWLTDDDEDEKLNPVDVPEIGDDEEESWTDEYDGGDEEDDTDDDDDLLDDDDDDDDDDFLDDDDDDDLMSVDDDDDLDNDNEDITGKSTPANTIDETINPDFEIRPHVNQRTTGRMTDHEPGTPGFDPSV